jgi:YVTN family beta-propeller protein
MKHKENVMKKYRMHYTVYLLFTILNVTVFSSHCVKAEPFAFVTNLSSDSVSVIDTATNSVIDTIVVGDEPIGVTLSPDGSKAYVSNDKSNNISVIDTSTNTVVATVPVGDRPRGVAITPNGTRVLVANSLSNSVSVIDTEINIVIATVPVGNSPRRIAITPNGANAYVTNHNDYPNGTVSVVNTTTNTVIATITVGSGSTYGVAITPDGTRAVVSNENSPRTSIIDIATNTVSSNDYAGGSKGVAITPDGTRAYVASEANVVIVDLGLIQTIGSITVNRAFEVAITEDGNYAYVPEVNSNTVAVIDTTTNSIVTRIPVGIAPFGIAISRSVNQSPIADAGPDQTIHVGTLATLDGSGSSDHDGHNPLSFLWTLVSPPVGSTAALDDPTTVMPAFTPDVLGNYKIELVVTDSLGATSEPDQVLISTYNTAPVADAGLDQAIIELGSVIQLDGTQSFDEDGDTISYTWAITSKPMASTASLDDITSFYPTFVADVHGDYVITLVVTDEFGAVSDVDTVTISFENVRPVADAGVNQSVSIGDTVFLDGSGSSDANFDLLSYNWSFVSIPQNSLAMLTDPTSVNPSFITDLPGTYVVSLVVNDGFAESDPNNVTVTSTSTMDTIIQKLREIIDTINSLDSNVFKNKNMKNTLTNKINATIETVDQGLLQEALDKLQNDILGKTDGCADLTNSDNPDKNDWIRSCVAQDQVYPLIIVTIGYFE